MRPIIRPMVSISRRSKISLEMPHLTVSQTLLLTIRIISPYMSCLSFNKHLFRLCNQSISAGPFQHDKMSSKWGKDKDFFFKGGQVIYEQGGEGMSITEAPDMTVASSSPWRCCGRQQKTSLVETGDTKEEYDMSRTKKKRGEKGA